MHAELIVDIYDVIIIMELLGTLYEHCTESRQVFSDSFLGGVDNIYY